MNKNRDFYPLSFLANKVRVPAKYRTFAKAAAGTSRAGRTGRAQPAPAAAKEACIQTILSGSLRHVAGLQGAFIDFGMIHPVPPDLVGDWLSTLSETRP